MVYTVEDPGFAPGRGEGVKGPLTAKRLARKKGESPFPLTKDGLFGAKNGLFQAKKGSPWPGLQGRAMAHAPPPNLPLGYKF